MRTVKITRTIRSQTLCLKELEALRGKTVEIIILTEDELETSVTQPKPNTRRTNAAGMLSAYRNPKLIAKESQVWTDIKRARMP